MENFTREIYGFLESCGLYIYKVRSGDGFESVSVKPMIRETPRPILLLGIVAESPKDASTQQIGATEEASRLHRETGHYPLIVTEDRWRRQNEAMRQRILSHFDIFTQIYARNCEIRRIDKATAQAFLEVNHSYGDAACKYRYGLYLKRHTGHNAVIADHERQSPVPGTLVAVATFSNARKWTKADKTIRSYEWTRYASLPDVRLSGGMGKILKTFIKEVNPDDIMTYADLEWSEGKVYEQLGFTLEGTRPSVTFTIDTTEWARTPMSSKATAAVDMPPPARGRKRSANGPADLCSAQPAEAGTEGQTGVNGSCALDDMPPPARRFFQNFGSNKYRLKLTDYQ